MPGGVAVLELVLLCRYDCAEYVCQEGLLYWCWCYCVDMIVHSMYSRRGCCIGVGIVVLIRLCSVRMLGGVAVLELVFLCRYDSAEYVCQEGLLYLSWCYCVDIIVHSMYNRKGCCIGVGVIVSI